MVLMGFPNGVLGAVKLGGPFGSVDVYGEGMRSSVDSGVELAELAPSADGVDRREALLGEPAMEEPTVLSRSDDDGGDRG